MCIPFREGEVSSRVVFIPLGPGSCEEVKLRVLQFLKETEEIVLASNSSWFPLGESFLAAKGIWLTDEEWISRWMDGYQKLKGSTVG